MTVTLATFAAALAAAGAAAGAGNSWSAWEPTYQGSITAPAGAVCPFAVTAEPVKENLQIRYHYDDSGNVDAYQVKGPLVARITNAETGASVQRNLSGPGTVYLHPDGSYDAFADGNFLVFFLAGDTPSHALLLLEGRTVLHGDPSGAKTLVSHSGRTENLCETLA